MDYRGFGDRCCGAVVRLRDLERHVNECDFRQVVCGLVERDGDAIGLPGKCEHVCALRDLENHRSVDCSYVMRQCANFGCDWTGSREHAGRHAEECKWKPIICRFGCGARMTNAESVERHEETCPRVEVTCGVVDVDDADESTRCCPVKMMRFALPRHRDEMCNYARTTPCPDCRAPVSERSAVRHKQTCFKMKRSCTAGCGALVSIADMKLHLEKVCPKVEIACEFQDVGCVVRYPRADMERHYAAHTDAHVKLLLRAAMEIREVSETIAKEVEKVVRDEEGLNESDRIERDGVIRAIRTEELRALEGVKRLRLEEADARKRGEIYAAALSKALAEHTETYDAAIAEIRVEMAHVRNEFESFKTTASFELVALREAIESAALTASDASARASALARGGGIFDGYKRSFEREIEHERKETLDEIAKASRQLRFEIQDANGEHTKAIASLREDIRAAIERKVIDKQ